MSKDRIILCSHCRGPLSGGVFWHEVWCHLFGRK